MGAEQGPTTMAHLTRSDIPFHYALADAFTVCDAYHCSLLGPTDPNRYHMWTGWVGNDGAAGGPVVDNAESRIWLDDVSRSGYSRQECPGRCTRTPVRASTRRIFGAGAMMRI